MRALYGVLVLASILATPVAAATIHKPRTHNLQRLYMYEPGLAVGARDSAIHDCNVAANKWSNMSWQSAQMASCHKPVGAHVEFVMEALMVARSAEAEWTGSLSEGSGSMKLGSGAFEGRYSFKSRFENEKGTNPEELIAAAHAGCFSMALALMLGQAGFTPRRIHTAATAHIERVKDGYKIIRMDLKTEADVPNIDEENFREQTEAAKRGCPVSQALAGTNITLSARLMT